MNVQAGGWRTTDSEIDTTTGTCSDTKVTLNLSSSSIVDGLVFAKLKPVKIVKSLDINYGNKALENLDATFENSFMSGYVNPGECDENNPNCSPSLLYNYSYPHNITFWFMPNNKNDIQFKYDNIDNDLLITPHYNTVVDGPGDFWSFNDDFMKFESAQFSKLNNPSSGVPNTAFRLSLDIRTTKTTP